MPLRQFFSPPLVALPGGRHPVLKTNETASARREPSDRKRRKTNKNRAFLATSRDTRTSKPKMKPKMPLETAEITAGCAADPPKAGKARLLTLDGLDRRTAAYAATRKLIDDIEGDLGGPDRLTTGERQLVQRAAVLGAVLTDTESRWIEGEPIDTTAYCTVVNAQRRVLETIGLKRVPRDVTPSVAEYLARKAAEGQAA